MQVITIILLSLQLTLCAAHLTSGATSLPVTNPEPLGSSSLLPMSNYSLNFVNFTSSSICSSLSSPGFKVSWGSHYYNLLLTDFWPSQDVSSSFKSISLWMQTWPHACVRAQLLQCPTLCYPMACIPPDSCVHGILQAKILEWVLPSPGDLPHSGVEPVIFPTQGSNPCLPCLLCLLHCRQILYLWATGETQIRLCKVLTLKTPRPWIRLKLSLLTGLTSRTITSPLGERLTARG